MTQETYVAATSISKIFWGAPATNTDDTPFDEAQYFGFTLYFLNPDNSPATSVSLPVAWSANGRYEYPIAALSLQTGDYKVAMTVTNKAGVESDRTAPVTFTLAAKPNPPVDLVVGVEAP
jgi:hypothetical protein